MHDEHLTSLSACELYFVMIHTDLDKEAAFCCIRINYSKVLYFIEI
jgi:hypothetical protein